MKLLHFFNKHSIILRISLILSLFSSAFLYFIFTETNDPVFGKFVFFLFLPQSVFLFGYNITHHPMLILFALIVGALYWLFLIWIFKLIRKLIKLLKQRSSSDDKTAD